MSSPRRSFLAVTAACAALTTIEQALAQPKPPPQPKVDDGEVAKGVEEGGGPKVTGKIKRSKHTEGDDQRWIVRLGKNGEPVDEKTAAFYLLHIRLFRNKDGTWNCTIQVVNVETGLVTNINVSSARDPRSAVKKAMEKLQAGQKGNVRLEPKGK